jgi:hypothetical protein
MKSPVNSKVLNTALKGFIKRLEKTETFVLDQAPDICKQMVVEGLLQAKAGLWGALGLLTLGILAISQSLPHDFEYNACEHISCSEPTRYLFLWLLGAGAIIVGAILAGCSIYSLFYLRSCPKLFLLREFRDLVKE